MVHGVDTVVVPNHVMEESKWGKDNAMIQSLSMVEMIVQY